MADANPPERFFRDRYGVSDGVLEHVLGSALARRADYGDLYFEFRTTEAAQPRRGPGQEGQQGREPGRRRARRRRREDRLRVHRRRHARRRSSWPRGPPATSRAAAAREQAVAVRVAPSRARPLHAARVAARDAAARARSRCSKPIDRRRARHDPRINNVIASLAIEQKLVMIATADGRLVGDVQPLARLNVTCIAEDAQRPPAGHLRRRRTAAVRLPPRRRPPPALRARGRPPGAS